MSNHGDEWDDVAYDAEYWSNYEMCTICGRVMDGNFGPHEIDFTENDVVNVHPNDKSKKHLFHRGCILDWCERKENCPICRTNINCKKLAWQEEVPVYELTVEKGGRRRRYKRKSVRRKSRKHKRRTHRRR
jgi:hypothetical protein